MDTEPHSHRFCTAPMIDWSDRHCRYFWRLLSRRARLYTEMITTGALLQGDATRFLRFDPAEHPVALQLGGNDPAALAACARLAEQVGFDEVNLNCGCPSDRVQSGAFGACLMATPNLVADCVKAMRDATELPVTVKHRIGIDDQDSYDFMAEFVGTVAEAGCDTFIVHARKAWLHGLSPKENREIPPLRYGEVHRLKREFPHLSFVINGGIETMADCQEQLGHVDGVMLGRAAYHNPYLLTEVDRELFGAGAPGISRAEIVESLLPYLERTLADGASMHHVTRHILGLYQSRPGGRHFRRHLSTHAPRSRDMRLLHEALALVERAA